MSAPVLPEGPVFLAPLPIDCVVCGRPAAWFAAGVSGCPSRCGARGRDEALIAEQMVRDYRDRLPALTAARREYARRNPPEKGLRGSGTRPDGGTR